MSERIKAGDVLNEAFQFGFHRFGTVLGFAWLPVLLGLLLVTGALFLVFDMQALEATSDPESLDDMASLLRVPPAAAVAIGVAGVVLMLALYSGVFASIFRLVALGEERPGIAHLRFDGPAQRVFWGQIILAFMNGSVLLAACLVALAMSGHSLSEVLTSGQEFMKLFQQALADPSMQPSEAELQRIGEPLGVFFLGFFLALPVMLYLGIKLVPFLPGSASENRLLLFGSFRMTFGHFWSILGVYVLFILSMLVLAIVYTLVMSFLELMAGLSGGGALALIGAVFGVVSFALGLAYQVFVMGVQLALQGIIYRRLKTGE